MRTKFDICLRPASASRWQASSGGKGTKTKAQLAVDGEKGKYPEFKGNVKAVDTRDLWREADVSPSNQGYHYHYNHNAETYYETGERLGRAMAALLKPSN